MFAFVVDDEADILFLGVDVVINTGLLVVVVAADVVVVISGGFVGNGTVVASSELTRARSSLRACFSE